MKEMDFSSAVLRNKGVPILLAEVRKGTDEWEVIYNSEGNVESKVFHLRFTHNTIADIEENFDGLNEWQEAMAEKPVSTLRKTMAMVLLEPAEKVGVMMIEGRLPEYNNAIGVAWGMANGVDPTLASQLLEQANLTVDSQIQMLNQEMTEALDLITDTLGEELSQPGAKPTSDSKTSGT